MDAEALRDAISKEMLDYKRPKLLTSQTSYILRPVINTGGTDGSLSSECNSEKCQPATDSPVTDTCSHSRSSVCIESVTTYDIISSVDGKVKPEVPGISAARGELDGNSVEMPSASTCLRTELHPDDVTMLSARSIDVSGDEKLKDEITTVNNSSDWTDTAAVQDNQTEITVSLMNNTPSNCNILVVNTDLPQTADAKARIKAALLNSGRRRQRLGQFTRRNSNSSLCLCLSLHLCLCLCLSLSLSLSRSVCLHLCLYLCLCLHLCLSLHLCLCFHLSLHFCLHVCLSLSLSLSISPSLSLSRSVCLHLSLHLCLFFSISVCLFISVSVTVYRKLAILFMFTMR